MKKDLQNKTKRNKTSIVSIILAIFLLLITLGGFATSSYFSYDKYFKGEGYDSSYNVRYEFDPYSRSEDPSTGTEDVAEVKEENVREKMNSIATAYSNMLAEGGISNSNVYSEVYTTKDSQGKSVVHAYLNTVLPNKKVSSSLPGLSDEDKKKQDITKSGNYYRGLDSARFSMIYCDGYTIKAEGATGDEFKSAKLYMWDLQNLTDQDSKINIDGTNKDKIKIQLKGGLSFGKKDGDRYTEGSVKQVFYDAKNAGSDKTSNDDDKKDEKYPFIYVIRDLRGLIERIQYITYVVYAYEKGKQTKLTDDIYNSYYQLSDSEKKMGEEILGEKSIVADPTSGLLSKYNFTNGGGFQLNPYDKLDSSKLTSSSLKDGPFVGTNNFANSAILTILQSLKDDKVQPGTTSDVNSAYPFLKKYIVGIVNRDNYTNILVDKNPNKSDLDSDGEWMVLENGCSSFYTTNQIHNQMTKNKFCMPLMDQVNPSTPEAKSSIDNILGNGLSSSVNISIVNNQYNGSLGQISDGVLTTVVALALFLLLIGLLVSLLYRIPGLISFVYTIIPAPLIFITLFMSGYGFTFPIVIGVIATILLSVVSTITIFNKAKKYHLSHRTLDQSINEAFKKSFLSVLDYHVIAFIIGACCLFFPIGEITALGISVLLGSIISFGSIYCLNFATNYLLFTNSVGMYKANWFSKYKISLSENVMPAEYVNPEDNKVAALSARGFDKDAYISRVKSSNSWCLNIKTFGSSLIICAILVLIGTILMFTIGVNSSSFYGGSRLMIQNNGQSLDEILKMLSGLNCSWNNITYNNDFFYLETFSSIDYAKLSEILEKQVFFLQNIDPQSTYKFTTTIVYILLSSIGLITLYSLIRYNWVVVAATALVSLLIPCVLMGVVTICRINFDVNINYAFILVSLMSEFVIFHYLSVLANKWLRKNVLSFNELKNAFAYSLSSITDNVIEMNIAVVLLVISMVILFPSSVWFMSLIIIIGLAIAYAMIKTILPYLVLICSNVKNHYKFNLHRIQSGIEKRNFDKIDEELINTINTNTAMCENR